MPDRFGMRQYRTPVFVALGAFASLVACAGDVAPIASSALLNAEYQLPISAGARVTARDGKWLEEGPDGRQSLAVIDPGVRGDLDGDKIPDAAVLLVYSGGGSGAFNYLAAVLNDQGRPRHVSSIELGDRVKVGSVAFEKGRVVASLVVHGANDPLCCPTVPVTRAFELAGGRLVELSMP